MPGPLTGVRVADFASFAVGPWAATLLGAMGADVIKVENPGSDPLRHVMPTKNGWPTTSSTVNANQRSVRLNFKDPDEHKLALNLAARADVLIENYRHGVMDRLGLGYQAIAAINPRIIYCSSSSFGSRGPMAAVGSTDQQGQAFSGYSSLTGKPGVRAEITRHAAQVDLSTSMYLVQAVVAALYYRERAGKGQNIQTSQMQAAVSLQTSRLGHYFVTGKAPRPMGSAVPHIVPSEAFEARDSRYVSISAVTPAQWAALCQSIGHAEWAEDPQFATNAARVEHRDELIPLIAAEIRRFESTRWIQLLGDRGVPCGPYLHYDLIRHHQHWLENELWAEMRLPDETPLVTGNVPWRFTRAQAGYDRTPAPGEQNAQIVPALERGEWPEKEG